MTESTEAGLAQQWRTDPTVCQGRDVEAVLQEVKAAGGFEAADAELVAKFVSLMKGKATIDKNGSNAAGAQLLEDMDADWFDFLAAKRDNALASLDLSNCPWLDPQQDLQRLGVLVEGTRLLRTQHTSVLVQLLGLDGAEVEALPGEYKEPLQEYSGKTGFAEPQPAAASKTTFLFARENNAHHFIGWMQARCEQVAFLWWFKNRSNEKYRIG